MSGRGVACSDAVSKATVPAKGFDFRWGLLPIPTIPIFAPRCIGFVPVPLEVDVMRIERIITAVTRTLTINVGVEIEAVRSFVRSVDFHLCYARMAHAMSALAAELVGFALGDAAAPLASDEPVPQWLKRAGMSGWKRRDLLCQPVLVPANCRARFARS